MSGSPTITVNGSATSSEINRLTSYPCYQTIKSRWFSKIPEHWHILRAKYLLQEVDDRSLTGSEVLLSMRQHRGLVPHNEVSKKRIAAEHLVGYKRTQPNDLVLNRMQAGNAMFFRAGVPGLVSPDYAVFRPLRNDNLDFLGFLFRSAPLCRLFRSESKGLGTGTSGFLRLYSDRFASLAIALPPREEQDQIVAYLRNQDAHIARFIAAKRKLIELLNEQKQAIIHQAVTHGLDPNARLKPSGVDWLGDVPEHWEVKRLKNLCSRSALYGANITATSYTSTGVRFLRTTDITDDGQLKNIGVYLPKDSVGDYLLQDGDVLISRSGTIGRSFLYKKDLHGSCAYAGYLVRFVPASSLMPQFLFLFTKTQAFAEFLRLKAISSTIENVNGEKYANSPLALPAIPEQTAICRWVEDACKPLEDTIQRAKDEINLIREYRERLIADVVTGQVDVRGWKPGPDDVIDEDELAVLSDRDENSDSQDEEEADDA